MKNYRRKQKQIMKNRLWALLLVFLGFLTIFIDNDATAFVFTLILALFVVCNDTVEIH